LWCLNIFRNNKFSLGEISINSIVDIYFDKSAVDLRRELLLDTPKSSICKTCSVQSYTEKSTQQERVKILEKSKE